MSSLGQRIRHLRNQAGLTQAQLASLCGWEGPGQGRIANYEKDRREPNLSDLRKIAAGLGIPICTLIEEPASGLAEPCGTYSTGEFIVIDQYSAFGSAGNGHMNHHVEVSGGLAFKRSYLQRRGLTPATLRVISVTGISMETTLSDGDAVLMDVSQREPTNDKIYVIRQTDGELLIKRLIRTLTGTWIVRSDNEDKRRFPDFQLTDGDMAELVILGRVVWHGGDL